ncbi:barstar family protein [Kitasatospora sp. YST-16]|uniref:barstar family protein n=1 Tax=unclassified Kitasatospora TaxID=2633591 RepID=UPI00068FB1DA|nr:MULTISPECIES: barstar family protein [unclassified Kitasatospora]WAL73755.1 barstar family protein [Kitasatospora sp. YST-16]WNW39825.1 barstar family protein [Streptomyces sp. Li-HN-5-13]
MQPVGHREWERPFPVRYLIVGEDENGEELLLGRCAAVEGLFTDPAPPPREVLVLRGCAPGAAVGWLGPALITGRSASGREYWWDLLDAEVLAVVPHAAGPALVDVVVGAAVGAVEDFRFARDPGERFELTASRSGPEPLAVGAEVTGLLVEREGPGRLPVQLVGCELTGPLRARFDSGYRGWPAYTELWALDDTGRVLCRVPTGLAVGRTWPSVLGGGLLDVLLSVSPDQLPGSAARTVWRQWQAGPPRQAGSWRGLGTAAKETWQTLALYLREPGPDRSGGEYHLDGREVEDVTGLHCAIGEAVNGPGGYYGREWNGLRDCLGGGFGLVPPFTLVWHDFAATEEELAADRDPATGLGYPEELARELERDGVTVVRA